MLANLHYYGGSRKRRWARVLHIATGFDAPPAARIHIVLGCRKGGNPAAENVCFAQTSFAFLYPGKGRDFTGEGALLAPSLSSVCSPSI